MVQRSIPYVNKNSNSMFWNSMWSSKNNFSKKLQKDFFIKNFIYFFFNDNFFINNLSYYKYNNNNINFKYNLNKNNINHKILLKFFKNSNKKIYTSKIWFIRYQNWIVVYLYVFKIKNNHENLKQHGNVLSNLYKYVYKYIFIKKNFIFKNVYKNIL